MEGVLIPKYQVGEVWYSIVTDYSSNNVEGVMVSVGDIVELINEDQYDGKFRGRMTVHSVHDNNVRCAHPDIWGWVDVNIEDLVVMEEAE